MRVIYNRANVRVIYNRANVRVISRGVNVLKRIRHVLLEEISIRERLKVSVLGGRIWISL